MLDQGKTQTETVTGIDTCDLVVIGAGIAGFNALNTASEYLNCNLSINLRDAFHFLTSVTGFFATHLLFRDQLRGQGFFPVDLEALIRADRNAWVGASAAQAYMNQVVSVQTLPLMFLDRCGLDLDRWYPLPRRMAGLLRMKASAKSDIAHCRRVLDRTAERFNIHAAEIQ